MNAIDLNRLLIFYYVYETKSVTAAAQKLYITPSAVSQQIKKFEDEFGTKLFLRTNRNMIPTSESQFLFPLVNDFITKIQEQRDRFKLGKHEPTGRLRICSPIIFGEIFLIDVVAKFKKKYPRVSFNLTFMNQPWVVSEKVLAGEFDFAIIDLIDAVQKRIPISVKPIIVEQQAMIGDKTLLASWGRKIMPYSEIIKFPFVAYLPNGEAEKLWCRKIYGKIPGELNIIFSSQSLHAMIAGVRYGLGLGLIPLYLIKKELKAGQLIKVKTNSPDYENKMGIAQAPDRKPSLAEKLFIELIIDEMKKRGKYL